MEEFNDPFCDFKMVNYDPYGFIGTKEKKEKNTKYLNIDDNEFLDDFDQLPFLNKELSLNNEEKEMFFSCLYSCRQNGETLFKFQKIHTNVQFYKPPPPPPLFKKKKFVFNKQPSSSPVSKLNSKFKIKQFMCDRFLLLWILDIFNLEKKINIKKTYDLKDIDLSRLKTFMGKYKYKTDKKKGYNLLFYSIFKDLGFLTYQLLKNDYYVNCIDYIGTTPLHWAYYYNNEHIIKLLKKYQADETNSNNFLRIKPHQFTRKNIELIQKKRKEKRKKNYIVCPPLRRAVPHRTELLVQY
jgi:hypothetical protein